MYSKLEDLLVKAATKERYHEELDFVIALYWEDFDGDQLKIQLEVFSSNIPENSSVNNFPSIL